METRGRKIELFAADGQSKDATHHRKQRDFSILKKYKNSQIKIVHYFEETKMHTFFDNFGTMLPATTWATIDSINSKTVLKMSSSHEYLFCFHAFCSSHLMNILHYSFRSNGPHGDQVGDSPFPQSIISHFRDWFVFLKSKSLLHSLPAYLTFKQITYLLFPSNHWYFIIIIVFFFQSVSKESRKMREIKKVNNQNIQIFKTLSNYQVYTIQRRKLSKVSEFHKGEKMKIFTMKPYRLQHRWSVARTIYQLPISTVKLRNILCIFCCCIQQKLYFQDEFF